MFSFELSRGVEKPEASLYILHGKEAKLFLSKIIPKRGTNIDHKSNLYLTGGR